MEQCDGWRLVSRPVQVVALCLAVLVARPASGQNLTSTTDRRRWVTWPQPPPDLPADPPPPAATTSTTSTTAICPTCGASIDNRTATRIRLVFGDRIADELRECDIRTTACDIGFFALRLASPTAQLRSHTDINPREPYQQVWCDDFWDMANAIPALRDQCITLGDMPLECNVVLDSLDTRFRDPSFDLAVLCSMVQPGPNFERTPHCSALALSTQEVRDTLTSCSELERGQCVDSFCDMYESFRHRLRPRNLQEPDASFLFPPDFVLPGCERADEKLQLWNFNTCRRQRDVEGMCDCLCALLPDLEEPTEESTCQQNADKFLTFGRLGVDEVDLTGQCQQPMCTLLGEIRTYPQCLSLDLPTFSECQAFQLPWISVEPCSWANHSGEVAVLECLDGHRCNVDIDTWACCKEHRGRARCPANRPVMCGGSSSQSSLHCGGSGSDTEYCCAETAAGCDQGRARECPAILMPYAGLTPTMAPTTTTPIVYAQPREGGLGIDLSIRLPSWSWILLLLIVPLCGGCVIVFLWRRRLELDSYEDPEAAVAKANAPTIDYENDKIGSWNVVRKPGPLDVKPPAPRVKVVVGELPEEKPLGLELEELNVVRVFGQGKRWGWEVGDQILAVAGWPVDTFEELWTRIQLERNRCPCSFLVSRGGDTSAGDAALLRGLREQRRTERNAAAETAAQKELDDLRAAAAARDALQAPPELKQERKKKPHFRSTAVQDAEHAARMQSFNNTFPIMHTPQSQALADRRSKEPKPRVRQAVDAWGREHLVIDP